MASCSLFQVQAVPDNMRRAVHAARLTSIASRLAIMTAAPAGSVHSALTHTVLQFRRRFDGSYSIGLNHLALAVFKISFDLSISGLDPSHKSQSMHACLIWMYTSGTNHRCSRK
jgi:hypothetical protein